jgi:hypothetical protein
MEQKQVYKAITAITSAMSKEGIAKNRKNTQGSGYNFRGIDDVLNSLSGLLAEHQLCIFPRVVSREQVERQSKNGGALFYTAVEVEFDFVSAVDGSMHTARMVGEAMDSSDKSSNKAMSAAYKYMALQTFCIPTEADNDPDAHSHEVAPRHSVKMMDQAEVDECCTTLKGCDDIETLMSIFAAAYRRATPSMQTTLKSTYDKRKAELTTKEHA